MPSGGRRGNRIGAPFREHQSFPPARTCCAASQRCVRSGTFVSVGCAAGRAGRCSLLSSHASRGALPPLPFRARERESCCHPAGWRRGSLLLLMSMTLGALARCWSKQLLGARSAAVTLR